MSHQQQQRRPRFEPPALYSILRGTVTRIEPYGCFVRLHPPTPSTAISISGLVHVSQLYANGRVENVNDVVSLDDVVWVKVMEVIVESIDVDGGDDGVAGQRRRHKIKLSMKYVDQETGMDVDPDNELLEDDLNRGGGGRGGGDGGRGFDNGDGGTHGADSALGRALASNIGIGSAIDPGNLILKGKRKGTNATTDFNGYALVGEEEGEPSPPPIERGDAMVRTGPSSTTATIATTTTRPMGRGRGTTLPAWMTRSDDRPPEGRLGSAVGMPRSDDDDQDGRMGRSRSKSKKKRRRDGDDEKRNERRDGEERRGGGKRRSKSRRSSRADERRGENRRRGGGRIRRSRSSSSSSSSRRSLSLSSSSSSSSISRDGSRGGGRRSSSRRNRRPHRRDRGGSSRQSRGGEDERERDVRGDHDGGRCDHGRGEGDRALLPHCSSLSSLDFATVEEARAIMERLERRRGL